MLRIKGDDNMEPDHAAELRRCAANTTNKLFADKMRRAADYIEQMNACLDAINSAGNDALGRIARH
jgi:hypothetical protein